MSFALRAGSDTLPMPLNLAQWKIQSNPHCPICCSRNPTTLHILNGCVPALNQGRYTWRHDSVLSCIVSWLTPTLGEEKCMYADLPGHRASDSPPATVPTDVLSTSSRPDLFLCVGSTIKIPELTVCSNTMRGSQMLDQANSVSKCILKWWVIMTLNLGATLFNTTSLKLVVLDITPTKHSKLYVTSPLS